MGRCERLNFDRYVVTASVVLGPGYSRLVPVLLAGCRFCFVCAAGPVSISDKTFYYLIIRSCKVWKPWDLFLELNDRSEIWQAPWQQCCRCTFQIWKWCNDLNCRSRGLWDFTISYDNTWLLDIETGPSYFRGCEITPWLFVVNVVTKLHARKFIV